MLQVRLGPVMKVVEKTSGINSSLQTLKDSQNELSSNPVVMLSSNATSSPLESATMPLCHKIRDSTLIYTSEIQVTFEAMPLRICTHHHKCLKHK